MRDVILISLRVCRLLWCFDLLESQRHPFCIRYHEINHQTCFGIVYPNPVHVVGTPRGRCHLNGEEMLLRLTIVESQFKLGAPRESAPLVWSIILPIERIAPG